MVKVWLPEALIHEEVRVGGAGEPYAVRTLLGWAIMGPLNGNNRSQFGKVNEKLSEVWQRDIRPANDSVSWSGEH